MPPKGKKVLSSSPGKRKRAASTSTPSIKPTFVNDDAAAGFEKSVVEKRCIQERGFKNPMGRILEIIEERDWELFAESPGAALVPVIREFYANIRAQSMSRTKEFKVLVRGKFVHFDRSSINNVYELPDIDEDDYSALVEQGPDYDQIIQFLAIPGTQWVMRKDKPVSFLRAELNAESRAWHYFIAGKLIPSYHVSDVSSARAVLNYAIQTSLSVDVGKVIERSIMQMVTAKRSQGLGHPSLIYELCLRAGVPTSATEEVQHPISAITPAMIKGFEQKEGTRQRSRSHVTPRSSQRRPAASSSHTHAEMDHLRTQMEEMQKSQLEWQAAITNRVDNMSTRVDKLLRRQQQSHEFVANYTNALTTMFSGCNMFQGAAPVEFPQAPTFTPPSSSPEAQEPANEEVSDSATAVSDSEEEDEEEDDEEDDAEGAEEGDEATDGSEDL